MRDRTGSLLLLCSLVRLSSTLGEVDEPQTPPNGYYVDGLNEIASGVGYVHIDKV